MDFSAPSGAIFNSKETHRYALWRKWDTSLPSLLFIGLNPSKADGIHDDPTTVRMTAHAKRLGYGGFFLLNCFTQIATDPKELVAGGDWKTNLNYLNEITSLCKDVVFAWGKHPLVHELGHDLYFQKRFPKAKCFGQNLDGSPKHPLYLSYITKLKAYSNREF